MASYKKLKSGWQYRVSYKGEDGKYKTKSKNGFRTKSEAQAHAEKLEKLLKNKRSFDIDISFVDYMKRWYELYKKDQHSLNNNKEIERSIDVVEEYFKNTRLLDVSRDMYQGFINWYGEKRATSTVKKVHMHSKSCLMNALADKHISIDPTFKISPKGKIPAMKPEEKYISYNETVKLIKEIKDAIRPDWHSRYMILISLSTGMRFGEILALNWNDINFEERTIDVNKSFDYRITHDFSTTKTTSSERIITIDEETVRILKKFKLGNDPRFKNNLFIEKTKDGYDHISNKAVNKALKKACNRAEIKEINFHGLRHTHCSLLLYSNLDIKYISGRMGHKTVAITYEIYSHIIEEMQQKESNKTNDFIEELYANAK